MDSKGRSLAGDQMVSDDGNHVVDHMVSDDGSHVVVHMVSNKGSGAAPFLQSMFHSFFPLAHHEC